jgi:DNA repair exonuclease SbcCD ATPase subunit
MIDPYRMIMNRFFLCLLLLLGCVRGLLAEDSSEQFLNAYQSYQQGEKLERDGSSPEALKKYKFAQSLLLEIEKNDPSWQKAVVEYRLKKTREGIERLQGAGNSNDGIMTQSPIPPSDGGSSTASPSTQATPSISIVPPGTKSSSGVGLSSARDSSSEVRRLKRMLETLRGELKEAKDAMSSEKNRTKDLENIKWVEERSNLEKQLQTTKDQVSSLTEKLQKRDSWENELKSLQKKLDDTVADKVAIEEEYQSRNKKRDDANAALMKQLEEARKSVSLSSAAELKSQQLSADLEKAKSEVEGMKEQFDHATRTAKDYQAKNEDLRKQMDSTNQKLTAAQKMAGELAPLRAKFQQLQDHSDKADADAKASNDKLALLKKESIKVESDSQKRESSLRADLQALEEERNALSGKVAKLSDAARDAGKLKGLEAEAEALKKTVAQLQENAVIAGREISKARAAADSSDKAAKVSSDKLSAVIASDDADRAALEEERQRLTAKLAEAVTRDVELKKAADKAGSLAVQIEELKGRLEQNSKSSDGAKLQYNQALKAANDHQSEVQRKFDASDSLKQILEKQNSSLQQQLKVAMGQMASLVDHGTDPSGLQDQIKKLQQQMDSSAADYAKSQQQIAEFTKSSPEQQKLIQQKEQELAAARQEAEKLRSELTQANQKNADLQHHTDEGDDRLKKLQDQLAALTKSIPEKDKQFSNASEEAGKLQSELADVKSKLSLLQKKNAAGDDQFKELKERLEEREAQLARYKKRKGKSGGDGNLVEENDLLRGIILRQVKDEARRSQARRLLEDEMKRLNVQSQTLTDQVTVLSSPSAELTPQERSLFKDGQLVVADAGDGKIQASISIPIKSDSEVTPDSIKKSGKQNMEAAAGSGNTNPSVVPSSPAPEGTPAVASNNASNTEIPWEGKLKECLAKAKDEFDRQDYLQSENTFREALKISADDYFALSNIGVVEFQLGKMTEAEEYLKRASAKGTDSSFALTTLGIVHYRQQRLDEAQKVLRKAVSINAQDFTAHNYLGIVLAASGDGKAGEGEIMKAIEINPQYADAHFNLAVIYATGKPPAKMMAKKHYAKAIELGAPPDPSLERLVQ